MILPAEKRSDRRSVHKFQSKSKIRNKLQGTFFVVAVFNGTIGAEVVKIVSSWRFAQCFSGSAEVAGKGGT